MTDQQPGEAGDLGAEIARSVARHLSTWMSGVLVTVGAISHDQQSQAAALLGSVIMYGIAQGWSVVEKYRAQRGARFP